jgi:predicted ferric reductase
MPKTGIRENNSELIDEAKENISLLFCSRNKKNYIFLDTLNNINRSLIPVEIQRQ